MKQSIPDLAERVMALPEDLQAEVYDYLQQCEEEAAMREGGAESGKVIIVEDENDDLSDLTMQDQEPDSMTAVG